MIKVAVVLIETCLAELAELGMKENAICVGACWEEFAYCRVWRNLNRLVVLNRNNR